ncbi:MAG: methyltransferase domain-containing protein [Opitutaceae bacterium]
MQATHATLLAGVGAFVLEIGSGHGHFLTAYAAAHPERMCLGLDIIAERVERAHRKKNRARLGNLHFLHASAEDFLATLPETARFADVFVLFPDPWPKRRHHKNRLMQADFLSQIAAKAGPGMRLYFRTDDSHYFAAAKAVVMEHPAWQVLDAPWAFEYETVFQERAPAYQSLVAAVRG